jgi:Ca2+-binding EF-hand superfamily protein
MFVRLDRDRSGQVTLEEYLALFLPTAKLKDVNKDGLLTPDEFPYPGSFALGDVDQSVTLTMDEAKVMYEKQFNGRDINKDGVVTADEM